jgi:hypothetical protein
MPNKEICNTDDVINSRDVIARIEELEGERDSFEIDAEILDEPDTIGNVESDTDASRVEWAIQNEDDAKELKVLIELAEEAEDYASDWRYGETLIRDGYFEDYARELAEDIGAIKEDASWPNNYIDWEAASEALKQDYTSVEFDGVTYWIR